MSLGAAPTNGNLDDLAAVVGYTGARMLQAWYAGRRLYVPTHDRQSSLHPLAVLLGRSAFRALLRSDYAGQRIKIPPLEDDQRIFRDREIVLALNSGETPGHVAARYNLTVRRVEQIRQAMTDTGLLDFEVLGEIEATEKI